MRRGAVLIAGSWAAGFIMWATLLAVAPILNVLGSELGISRSQLGLVFSLPVLALAVLAPVGGLLADRFGPRKVGTVGLVLVGVGGLSRAYATDLTTLLLFSVIFGAGWGLGLPCLPKIVGGWFEGKSAGTATGVYTTGIYAGAGVATAFTFSSSWRTNLTTWGVVSLVVALIWWTAIRDPVSHRSGPSRFREVAKKRSILILTGIFFLGANVTFYTLTAWLPVILLASIPSTAGLVSSLLSFSAAVATLAVPIASDRVGSRRPFLIGGSLVGAAATYTLFSGPPWSEAAAVILLGASISTVFVLCLTLSVELVDKDLAGSAAGFMLLAYAGGVLGPWLSGVTQDITGSFVPTMVILIFSFVASAVFALGLPARTGRPAEAG